MIDLDSQYIKLIKEIISNELKTYKLYIFGSRAKNTARKYSDIDIAIDSPLLTDKIKSKIGFEFENSTIPYEVDIIDLNNITDSFKNLIKNDLIELN